MVMTMSAQERNVKELFESETVVQEFKAHENYNLSSRRRTVLEMLKSMHFARLMDLGCGSGAYLEAKKQSECAYFGLDFSGSMIEVAQERATQMGMKKGVFLEEGDVESTPYPDNFFDVVLAIGLIEYFENPDGLINEIKRILKKDGILIIQSFVQNRYVHSLNGMWRVIGGLVAPNAYKVAHKQYGKARLDSLLAGNGFQLVDFSYSNFYLFPSPLAFYHRLPLNGFFQRMHALCSECMAKDPKRFGFLAVNYIGKYRLAK